MKDLDDWRERIDSLDRDIVQLLNERAECVLRLAPLKRQRNLDVLDPEREERVQGNIRRHNGGPLPHEAVSRIFDLIMAAMRDLQRERVAAD